MIADHEQDDRTNDLASFTDEQELREGAARANPEPQCPVPFVSSLASRFFGIPLMIAAVVAGCTAVVVILFGATTSHQQRTMEEMLQRLESDDGYKRAGLLLPADKEMWQIAREFALRLRDKESELTAPQLARTADRLATLLRKQAPHTELMDDMTRQRMHFVMQALALTELDRAVPPLVDLLGDPHAATRLRALSCLADMHEMPAVQARLREVAALTNDADVAVRVVACAALSALAGQSALARRNDLVAADALQRAYFDPEVEVQWNAALALARLGSNKGKGLLLDMLDRAYWEKDDLVRVTDPHTNQAYRRKLQPDRVRGYLIAAIDAAGHLEDAEIWTAIEALRTDDAPAVRDRAMNALRDRAEQPEGPQPATIEEFR